MRLDAQPGSGASSGRRNDQPDTPRVGVRAGPTLAPHRRTQPVVGAAPRPRRQRREIRQQSVGDNANYPRLGRRSACRVPSGRMRRGQGTAPASRKNLARAAREGQPFKLN